MDIDLSSIGVVLPQFWDIAKAYGFSPIIDAPDPHRSESWHFDCRGSHGAVYDYVQAGKAGTMLAPYTQMAQSSILAIGLKLHAVPTQNVAFLQAGLIRLGFDPGRIDGVPGHRTTKELEAAGADLGDPVTWGSEALRAEFPAGDAG